MDSVHETTGLDGFQDYVEGKGGCVFVAVSDKHTLDLDLLQGGQYEIEIGLDDSLQILVDANLTTGYSWIIEKRDVVGEGSIE